MKKRIARREEAPIRRYAVMTEEYVTESGNLGWRAFEKGKCYQVDETQIREFVESEVCEIREASWMATAVPIRRIDRVIAKVTRWFTSNGLDTHYLNAGEISSVPSNLAVYLVANGFAEVA